MPLERGYTKKDGKTRGWYRWGESGQKYFYEVNNSRDRERAKSKAKEQGRAIEASKNS